MNRRSLITGLGSLFLAAPAIVRASSMDLVRGVPLDLVRFGFDELDGWPPKPPEGCMWVSNEILELMRQHLQTRDTDISPPL